MNQSYKIGDEVQVIGAADENDNKAMGKIGKIWKINPKSPKTTYWVEIKVEGCDDSKWAFADWQIVRIVVGKNPPVKVKESKMSLVHEVSDLNLTANERLFRKHGLKDSAGGVTEEGVSVLAQILFTANEENIAKVLKEIDKANEKKKK